MIHSILPPHLVEHLAVKSPAFRKSLALDIQIRLARTATTSSSSSEVTVYDAKDSLDLPGEKVEGEGPEEAVRVRQHAQVTQELMGEGKPLPQTDIPELVVNYGENYPNAFYDGQYLVFGNGESLEPAPEAGEDDVRVFGDFTASLDVFAHEFGHKIIDSGPKLEYAGQPGALNESLADVIGVCVRAHAQPDLPEEEKWRIGAELFLQQGPALRDMDAPGTAYENDLLGKDPQVGHMKEYVETFLDNGGVHINSGIPNKAFVEASKLIGGNVWETPLRVWLTAMDRSQQLTDFDGFAKLTVEAAAEESDEVKQHVTTAWQCVGIDVEAADGSQGQAEEDAPEVPAEGEGTADGGDGAASSSVE